MKEIEELKLKYTSQEDIEKLDYIKSLDKFSMEQELNIFKRNKEEEYKIDNQTVEESKIEYCKRYCKEKIKQNTEKILNSDTNLRTKIFEMNINFYENLIKEVDNLDVNSENFNEEIDKKIDIINKEKNRQRSSSISKILSERTGFNGYMEETDNVEEEVLQDYEYRLNNK